MTSNEADVSDDDLGDLPCPHDMLTLTDTGVRCLWCGVRMWRVGADGEEGGKPHCESDKVMRKFSSEEPT
jgi:hypothetical protein